MHKFTILPTLLAALLLSLATPAVRAQHDSNFKLISLSAGIFAIRAEVAARDIERQQGLMFRKKMAPNEGMVFVFEAPTDVCMWMKNTLLPLSVAFLDDDGKIVNIEDMAPQSTESHCAKKAVRYALEMNQGWFKQKNIRPGNVVEGLPRRE